MTANPPAWSVDDLRGMSKAERLTATSIWVAGFFEEFTGGAIPVEQAHLVDDLNVVAISVLKQATAILDADFDAAQQLHEECERLIESWEAPV